MPNYTYCMNCFSDKTPDRYGERLCLRCETTGNEAAEYARREGLDVGAARQQALSTLTPHSMAGKHPGMAFDRISTDAIS